MGGQTKKQNCLHVVDRMLREPACCAVMFSEGCCQDRVTKLLAEGLRLSWIVTGMAFNPLVVL